MSQRSREVVQHFVKLLRLPGLEATLLAQMNNTTSVSDHTTSHSPSSPTLFDCKQVFERLSSRGDSLFAGVEAGTPGEHPTRLFVMTRDTFTESCMYKLSLLTHHSVLRPRGPIDASE